MPTDDHLPADELTTKESDRLAALRRHDILDTAADPRFDRIVALLRKICRVPITLVSLVDSDRQWFKARSGVDTDQTPLDTSVCALAIQQRGVSRSRTCRATLAPRPCRW